LASGELTAKPHAFEVDIHDLLVDSKWRFQERYLLFDARIIDQDIEFAIGFTGSRDKLLNFGRVADISRHGRRISAERAYLFTHVFNEV